MVLKTMSEVQQYLLESVVDVPEMAWAGTLIGGGEGIAPELCAKLKLPDSYVDVATEFRLAGVSIGLFNLSPSMRTLEEGLLEENANDSLVRQFGDTTLVAVGCYESNPICVASAASEHAGRVYFLDVMTAVHWKIFDVADDFERFIILAANFFKISDVYAGNRPAAQTAMTEICDFLHCSDEQVSFWNQELMVSLFD